MTQTFTQQEVEFLKVCLKEIIDENYFSTIHELRKKLVASDAKQQEIESRLAQYKEDIKRLEECHKCHSLVVEHRDMSTQTIEVESDEELDEEPPHTTVNTGQNHDNNHSMQNNGLERPLLEDTTTTTSEIPCTSTSYEQEPPMQPKMEIQTEGANYVSRHDKSKENSTTPASVECITISDDE